MYGGILRATGRGGNEILQVKPVKSVDTVSGHYNIWHVHRQLKLEEPMHPTFHKFIIINVLQPISKILHISFSAPFSRN
jgi:hypothetical protein